MPKQKRTSRTHPKKIQPRPTPSPEIGAKGGQRKPQPQYPKPENRKKR